ncbi:hypothetical protein KC19_VG203200, partial [Ceratodon purpureus]
MFFFYVCLVVLRISIWMSIFHSHANEIILNMKTKLVLLTSCSCIVLEKLKIPKKATMRVSALSTSEAQALFS